MGLKAHQMDVETPQGAETDQRVCTREEEDVPPEAAWQSLTQGGCAFSTRTLALEGP
jgi:hypothetical protein